MRLEMQSWGPAKDEFFDSGGGRINFYVREARRMISDYVMTEQNCRRQTKAEDPVGLAALHMDSHNCRRIVKDGRVENEGDVQVGGFRLTRFLIARSCQKQPSAKIYWCRFAFLQLTLRMVQSGWNRFS